MEILTFKIKGKFAHFRKYYANNTALSFTIPPRTSLMGIVASYMGFNRDSYYEMLSSENIEFGVRVLSPLKKSFQRLNFLSIKSQGDISKDFSSDFRGDGGRIQTPFEIVTGLDLKKDEVIYQIFIKEGINGPGEFRKVRDYFIKNGNVYTISFGIANFIASITDIVLINDANIKKLHSTEYVNVNSAVAIDNLISLEFEKDEFDNYNFIEEDMMPADFVANGNREVSKMNKIIFSITKNPLRVKLKNDFYNIILNDEIINIQFLE